MMKRRPEAAASRSVHKGLKLLAPIQTDMVRYGGIFDKPCPYNTEIPAVVRDSVR